MTNTRARLREGLGRFLILALVMAGAGGVVIQSAFGSDEVQVPSSPRSGSTSTDVGAASDGPGGEGQVGAASDGTELTGGPIVVMGIDAEDGGPGDHGPVSVYSDVLDSVIANTTNGGSGILVIGGGKSPTDDVTAWWNAVTAVSGITPTYVNGAANIATQTFAGFRVIGVVSGDGETGGGGLTAAESDALATRQADVATFVNGGGGLLVFAQDFNDATTSNYAFLGGIGAFTFTTELSYNAILPTPDGSAIGITNDLDICCWHDVYLTYPPFLAPLAIADDSGDTDSLGKVAALGGRNVFIGERPAPEPEVPATPSFTG